MRTAFVKTLVEIAERDKRVFMLTGDLGYMALEPFMDRFPDRFINVGVAEQNMIGIATGLAESGYIPFAYSIVTFATLRPYEFIRNGPVLHNLPVRIVGVGGGLEYGHNGASHWGLEDVAVMRVQPNMTVIAPADHEQTKKAVENTWDISGPIYYRLGKDDKTLVTGLNGKFTFGQLDIVQEGKDVLLISMGAISADTAQAIEELNLRGLSCGFAIASTINPPPVELDKVLSNYKAVITVEAHYKVGGIGSLVAETIAEKALNTLLVRMAVDGIPDGITGSQAFMYSCHGLSKENIVNTVLMTADKLEAKNRERQSCPVN
jgi:transketolase